MRVPFEFNHRGTRPLVVVVATIVVVLVTCAVNVLMPEWATKNSGPGVRLAKWVGSSPFFEVLSMIMAVLVTLLCLRAFRSGLSLAVRVFTILALLVVCFLPVRSCMSAGDPGAFFFNEFSNSVSTNADFEKVVVWARDVLSKTNALPSAAYTGLELDRRELPKELFSLYKGPTGAVTRPSVGIFPTDGGGYCVVILFMPGSTLQFAIYIGGKDYVLPPGRMKAIKQLQDGVFVAGDW